MIMILLYLVNRQNKKNLHFLSTYFISTAPVDNSVSYYLKSGANPHEI